MSMEKLRVKNVYKIADRTQEMVKEMITTHGRDVHLQKTGARVTKLVLSLSPDK